MSSKLIFSFELALYESYKFPVLPSPYLVRFQTHDEYVQAPNSNTMDYIFLAHTL
jgi:hypothetical protein